MFHCPFCKTSAHARTSRYLSDNVKQRYHQCVNIECSATFRTLESVDGVIRSPATEPAIPHPNRQPPLTAPVRNHARPSGETHVTTLQKAFETCQADKSAWLQRRAELAQTEQAYREQLALITATASACKCCATLST